MVIGIELLQFYPREDEQTSFEIGLSHSYEHFRVAACLDVRAMEYPSISILHCADVRTQRLVDYR